MKTAPEIIVQLIHIEGPLKGQIQELSDPEIRIGRHPSCQLRFPADYNIISRQHATITREGNRFKLTDQSANGTIVNGKKIKEVYLKDGDVITIAEGGPKVSFLTEVRELFASPAQPAPQPLFSQTSAYQPPPPQQQPPPPQQPQYQPPPQQQPHYQPPAPQPLPRENIAPSYAPPEPPVFKPAQAPIPPARQPEPPAPPRESKEPLIIQYGPTLRSFNKLPLRIGRHPSCEFQLDHPGIIDMHAEIYFADGEYWVRDLTGQQLITVNRNPAGQGVALRQNDELFLSPNGPFFQFLGKGRLGELERPVDTGTDGRGMETGDQTADKAAKQSMPPKPMSFLKKIFSKE
ncbi:MAG: FHA domain-containing protein [Deltaproteobacteria bacterium]|nr:FHA domain-containing protein [Deltaproteobacteria bacterium]